MGVGFMKNKFLLVVIMIVLLVCMCSCGKKSESISDNENLPQIVIGSDNYEPFNYVDSNMQFAGVDVEIAKEAFKRLGYRPVFKQIEWENKDEYLKTGEVDCLWGSFTMTGREDLYQWSGPYMYSNQVIVVRVDSDIHTLKDLEGKRVAVQVSTKPEELLLDETNKNMPDVKAVYTFSTMEEIYSCLRKGYCDAIAGHEDALNAFINSEDSSEYRMIEESLYISELGVAFEKGTDIELSQELTQTLQDMKDDGTIGKILKKYGLNVNKALGGDF